MTMHLIRYFHPEQGIRCGVLQENTVSDVTDQVGSIAAWLHSTENNVAEAITNLSAAASASETTFDVKLLDNAPSADQLHWLAPVDTQDVWAAGVTYIRSRAARQEEAVDGGDVYARVYDAERPEIFFKARGRQVVGHLDTVGIRSDATWSVPEPELGLVLNPALEIVGFTVGNDMSSRDIEGENPLYLPQAKMYRRSCSLGQGLLLQPATAFPETDIQISIQRGAETLVQESISTTSIKRTAADLVTYLGRCVDFPDGVVLLTGTGIVPPADFTLHKDDVIEIAIDGIGVLKNTVEVV